MTTRTTGGDLNGQGPGELDRAEAHVWESFGLTPRHHDVDLARTGTTVHITEVGDPAGPPVLFVHGGSVAGPSWADLAAKLPPFRCLLLDRPGCGRSEPLDIDGVEELLDVADSLVVEVLDGLGLERASLVGTSYGGPFAMRAAAAQPQRIDRLVLIGWCLGMPGTVVPGWFRFGTLPGVRSLNGAIPPSARMLRGMLARFGMRRAMAEGRFSDEAIDWLVALYRETDTMRNEFQTIGSVTTLRSGWDARLTWPDTLLDAVTAPTLVLFGDEDPFGTVEGARSLSRKMDDVTVVILTEAGHAPWLDQPDTCAAAMVDHLTVA